MHPLKQTGRVMFSTLRQSPQDMQHLSLDRALLLSVYQLLPVCLGLQPCLTQLFLLDSAT